MSKFLSLLSRDHVKRAESFLRVGDKGQAAGEYSKAGDHNTAARLAAEIGDEAALIKYTLAAALGTPPSGYQKLNAREAGDLLAAQGHHRRAITLFELAGDFRRAAVASLRLGQVSRAAQLYERARAWPEAALYYEQADLPGEALRVLQHEANELIQQSQTRSRPGAFARLEDVNLKRAEMLLRLGKIPSALDLLRQVQASPQKAQLLEKAGRHADALTLYLEQGMGEDAARLARSSPDAGRLEAMSRLRSGRPQEAGDLYARAGHAREAAEAYEAAQNWAMAAYRWEAAEEPARGAENYLRAGRKRDAARCYASAGDLDRAVPLYVESGDCAAAANLLVQAGRPLEAVGQLVAAGQVERAAKVLDQVSPSQPGFAETTLSLVPGLLQRFLPAEALARLQRLPAAPLTGGRLAPEAVDRLYWEGRAMEALGQDRAARALFRQVLSFAPQHRDTAQRLDRGSGEVPAIAVPSIALGRPASAPRTAADEPLGTISTGSRLAGRYDILGELGRGGMGIVFKARDLELDELVAVKVLGEVSAVPLQQERLLREVQICRRISHPNVVRVFDMGRFSGGIFVTMELLEGQTLEALMVRSGRLPFERVRQLLRSIATGLAEAHGLGIVHRDLKPANLFLTERGLKILDFGIARMTGLESQQTQTGLVFGSPAFMSPEQLLAHPLDGRSDLYSLGVLAFMLITGRVPFHNDNPNALALAHLHDAPPDLRSLRPETPAAWADFVGKLLAKKPDERYASAGEVLAALNPLPEGDPLVTAILD